MLCSFCENREYPRNPNILHVILYYSQNPSHNKLITGVGRALENVTPVYIYFLFADSEHEFHFEFMCQTSAPQNLTRSANVSIRVTYKSYQGSQERLEDHINNVCLDGALSDLQVQENLVNVPIASFAVIMVNSDFGDLRRMGCLTNMSGTCNSFVLSKLLKLKSCRQDCRMCTFLMSLFWLNSLVLFSYRTYYICT